MLELDAYRRRAMASPLDKYPYMWSIHYGGDRVLGEFACQPGSNICGHMFYMLVPFAYAVEVTTSTVIFEASSAPGPFLPFFESQRCLYASTLAVDGAGLRTTHWIIPYRLDDDGRPSYDEPYKSPYFVPQVNELIGVILDQRSRHGGQYSWEETCAAVLRT